jgi:ferredoxin
VSDDFRERRIGGATVRIDRTVCIGSGSCTRVAPEVFELDSGQIVTFAADPPAIDRDRLAEACGVCPVDALALLDADGTPLVD